MQQRLGWVERAARIGIRCDITYPVTGAVLSISSIFWMQLLPEGLAARITQGEQRQKLTQVRAIEILLCNKSLMLV